MADTVYGRVTLRPGLAARDWRRVNEGLVKLDEMAPEKILFTTKPAFESWLPSRHLTNVELVAEQSRSEEEKLGDVGALAVGG